MVGFEPTTTVLQTVALPLSYFEPAHAQNRSSKLLNRLLLIQIREIGQGDGIRTRTVRVTGGDAHCYITTLIKWPAEPKPAGEDWSPWSDSHRRIRVYETRPVASEAQRL